MTAVAVWDERPTAETLLQSRLARGWQPTPTATRDGDKVLGYAACAVAQIGGTSDSKGGRP